MRRLDRYILKELLVPFLIGTGAVVLMFQANLLIYQLKNFQLQAVPVAAILQIVLYSTPSFLIMTLPVGTALASSLALSRLVRESELTAIRATGTSILRVMLPLTLFGIVVSLSSWYIVEKVVPNSEKRAKKVQTEAMIIGGGPQFKANVIVNLRDYVASFGTVAAGPDRSIQLSDILLIERSKKSETALFTAKTGTYKDGVWQLHDVYGRFFANKGLVTAGPQSDLVINERITLKDFFEPPESPELTTSELLQTIKEGKAAGRDVTTLEVDYYCKFSVPAACAIFALVSPIFAVWLSRSGAFVGVFLSTIITFLYYNMYIISTTILGRNAIVSPIVAAWLPNVLFLVLGIFALRRLE